MATGKIRRSSIKRKGDLEKLGRSIKTIKKDIQYEKECIERIAEMLDSSIENAKSFPLAGAMLLNEEKRDADERTAIRRANIERLEAELQQAILDAIDPVKKRIRMKKID